MNLSKLFLSFLLFSVASANSKIDSPTLPRPLILQHPAQVESLEREDETQLRCTSWRFAGEGNNLSPWKTIPQECAEYVKNYMMGKGYNLDLEFVSRESGVYARSVELVGDGMDVWIFDVDETLLSNLPYYAQHGFGLEVFDGHEFDKWVEKAMAPVIEPCLRLYEEVQCLGFKVFLLTGRNERHRSITVQNLKNAGYRKWDKLILRGMDDHGKPATIYKSERRREMVKEGYRIMGNSGDQWSDILGFSMSNRSFKLPNPLYFIP